MSQRCGSPIRSALDVEAHIIETSTIFWAFPLDFSLNLSLMYQGMQYHLGVGIGRVLPWRRYPSYRHVQNARHYTPSSCYQASYPPSKFGHSPSVTLPKIPPKSRWTPLELPRARQTETSEWGRWKLRVVTILVVFVSGITIVCYFSLQRVPITGRRQLDIIPHWFEVRTEKFKRKEEDKLRKDLLECSFGHDHPGLQGVNVLFYRLVRASGLVDRDWEFPVILAPSE